MTITEKLKLELIIREHIDHHGEQFYEELAKILAKIDSENVDMRGKPSLRMVV